MGKKVGISLLVLIITGCLLVSAGLIAGGYFLLKAQKNYTPPTAVVAPTAVQTSTSSIESQMDVIQQQVSDLRGLSLKADLQRDLMTPAELKDKVVNDFFKDYTDEEVSNDTRELTTLGLLPAGFDLRQFYLDLYTEQIAGYYDDETKEMYVISGEGFGGMERMTYAHEFNHVLQDQNYDMENGLKLNDETCEADSEYCAAVTALIEGDSSLAEQLWFMRHGTNQDRQDLQDFYSDYSSPVYDSAPEYMKKDFLFPYQQGLEFVQSLYDQDAWEGVESAYRNLPVSTEQILHPEKYPGDTPVKVEVADLTTVLGEGWQEIDRNVMGEWYTYLILSSGSSPLFRMDDDRSRTAAEGWGGDTYLYYTLENASDYFFAWQSSWETKNDGFEFFDLAVDYGMARWGIPDSKSDEKVTWTSATDGTIAIYRNGTGVLWLMGSSSNLLDLALPLFSDFLSGDGLQS